MNNLGISGLADPIKLNDACINTMFIPKTNIFRDWLQLSQIRLNCWRHVWSDSNDLSLRAASAAETAAETPAEPTAEPRDPLLHEW